MTWKRTKESFITFVNYLNTYVPLINNLFNIKNRGDFSVHHSQDAIWVWLVQLVRSLHSSLKVPGSIPGFAETRIIVQPSFPPKLTQHSILPGR